MAAVTYQGNRNCCCPLFLKPLLLLLTTVPFFPTVSSLYVPSRPLSTTRRSRSGPSHYSYNLRLDDDDSEARSIFGTKEYWDDLYQGRGDFPADEYSWYFGWEGYGPLVQEYIGDNQHADILVVGIGNDPILLNLLQKGYTHVTATDYSASAMERQEDLLSYSVDYSRETTNIELLTMDARRLDPEWTHRFDAVLEKGALDAIYLSGDGNLERTVAELERVMKPETSVLISVSGVVPAEVRRNVFRRWKWIRDGTEELKAGCFVLRPPPR